MHMAARNFSISRSASRLLLALSASGWVVVWAQPQAQAVSGLPSPADQNRMVVSPIARPLTLREIFESASRTHPAMAASRHELAASGEDLTVARRARWPSVSLVAETRANSGASTTTPQRYLSVEQSLYDFGRKEAAINEASAAMLSSEEQVAAQQLNVFIEVSNAWQSLKTAQYRIRVAEATLNRLNRYKAQMERRVAAQASPRIDLELSQARVLQTRVELTGAQTTLRMAITRLEQLSSLEGLTERVNAMGASADMSRLKAHLQEMREVDWYAVAAELPAVRKAQMEVRRASAQVEAKQAAVWPQVYARLSIPIISSQSHNNQPSVFVGLQYAPSAGFSDAAQSRARAARLQGAQQQVDAALRDGFQALQNDRDDYVNAVTRHEAIARATEGSEMVLASYERQFQAGRKTWQDLLNTSRELAQNQYAQAELEAYIEGTVLRLQVRMRNNPYYP